MNFKDDVMLVLSRKKSESIVINGNIIVTVVEVGGGKVKLSFDAPASVVIDRKEIFDAKKENL
jgi:carbon storage regulator